MANHLAIRRLAGVLALLTLVLSIALPLFAISSWLFIEDLAGLAQGVAATQLQNIEINLPYRLAGLGIALLGAGVQAYGLLALRQTFLEAAAARYLSTKAINGFRVFAWVSVAMVAYGILQHSAYGVIFSLAADGPGALSLRFGTSEFSALFVSLLFVFCAHLFAIGREAEQENAAFL